MVMFFKMDSELEILGVQYGKTSPEAQGMLIQ
jgi:hypothetical protein